jgi:hypothetical protein
LREMGFSSARTATPRARSRATGPSFFIGTPSFGWSTTLGLLVRKRVDGKGMSGGMFVFRWKKAYWWRGTVNAS